MHNPLGKGCPKLLNNRLSSHMRFDSVSICVTALANQHRYPARSTRQPGSDMGSRTGLVRRKRIRSAWERERVAQVGAHTLEGDAGARGLLGCIIRTTKSVGEPRYVSTIPSTSSRSALVIVTARICKPSVARSPHASWRQTTDCRFSPASLGTAWHVQRYAQITGSRSLPSRPASMSLWRGFISSTR
jgi:hypothetical protein